MSHPIPKDKSRCYCRLDCRHIHQNHCLATELGHQEIHQLHRLMSMNRHHQSNHLHLNQDNPTCRQSNILLDLDKHRLQHHRLHHHRCLDFLQGRWGMHQRHRKQSMSRQGQSSHRHRYPDNLVCRELTRRKRRDNHLHWFLVDCLHNHHHHHLSTVKHHLATHPPRYQQSIHRLRLSIHRRRYLGSQICLGLSILEFQYKHLDCFRLDCRQIRHYLHLPIEYCQSGIDRQYLHSHLHHRLGILSCQVGLMFQK